MLPCTADIANIIAAIEAAKAVTDAPSIIKVRTTIGKGSAKQGTHGVHGSPLGDDDIKKLKASFGLDPAKTYQVPDEVHE